MPLETQLRGGRTRDGFENGSGYVRRAQGLYFARGRYAAAVMWNWPTLSLLSYQRWRYRSGQDGRAWYARARVGPVKVEATKWR